MFKILKFLFFLLFFVIHTLWSPIHQAYAQSTMDWTTGNSGRCVGTGLASDVATIQGLECLFFNILQVIVYFAGLAFFITIIVGGFQYLTSSSDQKAVAAAGSTLTMAIAGLIGVILSWLILRLIQNFTGINVIDFIIPG